ncbi:MAG: hypothetical protein ACJ790_16295 [Myxococcaceae bacterium]
MNKPLVAAIGLSVVSLGVAIYAVSRSPESPAPSSSSAMGHTQVASDTAALEARIHALETTSEILARRVRSLEVMAAADGGVPQVALSGDPALEAQVKMLQGQVRDLSAGLVLDSDTGKQAMKDLVKETQSEMFDEQAKQRTEQWANNLQQQQTAKLERWKKFVGEASLDYSQETLLMQKMKEESDKQQALIDQMRSGEKQPRDVRQEMRTLRTDTDTAMKQSLSDDQYKQYEETRREDRGPGGGGRGGFNGFGGFGSGRNQQQGGQSE